MDKGYHAAKRQWQLRRLRSQPPVRLLAYKQQRPSNSVIRLANWNRPSVHDYILVPKSRRMRQRLRSRATLHLRGWRLEKWNQDMDEVSQGKIKAAATATALKPILGKVIGLQATKTKKQRNVAGLSGAEEYQALITNIDSQCVQQSPITLFAFLILAKEVFDLYLISYPFALRLLNFQNRHYSV